MTVTVHTFMQNFLSRWAFTSVLCALLVGFGPAPSLAQNSSQSEADAKKLKQLKQSFALGKKAAQANKHEQAYAQLGQALQLAQDLGESGAENQIREKLLRPLSKQWGNQAIDNERYDEAVTHFDKGIQYAEDDAYMYYGKGLALINLDSTQAGLETLQQAIEVGNRTGNTRVTGLAQTRIRDEFLAEASKALNAQDPTTTQADAALAALDEMQQYVEPNAQSLFYRGRAHFEKREYEAAIDAAQKGLDMHQGSRSDAAKFYFIVAESQLNLGNKSTACQTFQNATFGDYKARAEHYLKNVCEE